MVVRGRRNVDWTKGMSSSLCLKRHNIVKTTALHLEMDYEDISWEDEDRPLPRDVVTSQWNASLRVGSICDETLAFCCTIVRTQGD